MRELKLHKVLDFYDVPQVFIAVDVMKTKYMCLMDKYDRERGFIYLGVQISDKVFDDYKSKRVDLRTLFLNPEFQNTFFNIYVKEQKILAEQISSFNIDVLPEEGFYYDDEEDEEEDARNLIDKTTEVGSTIVRLGFVDQRNSHEIDSECLSQGILMFQKMVQHCHQHYFGKHNINSAQLRVTTFSAASFDVEFRSMSQIDLFGSSDICYTLNEIDKLMNTQSEGDLRNMLAETSASTISSFRGFIKVLNDNRLSVKYKWASSISASEVVSREISAERVANIQTILDSNRELDTVIRKIKGVFLASSVKNGKWTFKIEDDDSEIISGDTDDYGLLSGVVIEKQRYKIEISETIIQKLSSLTTENHRVLKSISIL